MLHFGPSVKCIMAPILGTPSKALSGTQRQHRALGTPIVAFVLDLCYIQEGIKRCEFYSGVNSG